MGATLATQAVSAAMARLGRPVLYTPASSGIPRPVQAHVEYDVQAFPGGFDSSVSERRTEIYLLAAEVPEPAPGDRIAVDGARYRVEDVMSNDRNLIRVAVTRG